MKKNTLPTDSELEILQVLWNNGPSTVRTVNEKLNESREVGYTTTLKLMQIMVEKGTALRNTSTRTHVYTAGISKTPTQQNMLQSFITQAFEGSAASMILQALGNNKTHPDDLREIKELIEKLQNEQK